ncbi:MAG: hypothetical protein DSY59_01720 [Persephonella sp.]|nr:MAG: hypothetical protein DSY60_02825 [Persephonella sp.]RUM61295.1 MAG: hypothetical protein DSY59_01720 [Persephonella sp.]
MFEEIIKEFLHKFFVYSTEVIPFFFIASIIGALIQTYFKINIIRKFINHRILSPIVSALFGASAPVCSCSMIPIAQTINSFSRYYSPVIAFLVSAPALSPVIFFLMLGMFSVELTIYRFLFGIALAVIGGLIADFFFKKPRMLGILTSTQKSNKTNLERFKESFKSIFIDTGKYVLLGLVIASFMSAIIPPPLISKFADLPFSYLLIAVLSIPLYLSAGEEVPIGKSLLDLGLSPGQVLTFMFAGSGICLPTIMATIKFFPKKLVYYYIFIWLLGSIIAGISYDLIFKL